MKSPGGLTGYRTASMVVTCLRRFAACCPEGTADDWANALGPDSLVIPDWPEDLFEVIYIDNYGNLITGVRASVISEDVRFEIGGWQCAYQRVFAEAPDSAAFWYENANGLVEIAIAGSSAQDLLGIKIGDELRLVQ